MRERAEPGGVVDARARRIDVVSGGVAEPPSTRSESGPRCGEGAVCGVVKRGARVAARWALCGDVVLKVGEVETGRGKGEALAAVACGGSDMLRKASCVGVLVGSLQSCARTARHVRSA